MSEQAIISITPGVNAAGVVDLHAALLEAYRSGGAVQLDLEADDESGAPGVLALQLLVSARLSFAEDLLTLGASAAQALKDLERPSPNQEHA